MFCDASEIAYEAVPYFRAVTCGLVNVSFIISTTRLAPIQALTIPRLELQAALIASRLKCKILNEIDVEVDQMHFWSDSKIVLHYLSNTQRRYSTYVSHRVAEIASTSDVKEWHHTPGKMNVADDCTRAKEMHELTPQCRWISGPELFILAESEWPSKKEVPVVDESELGIKGSVLAVSTIPSCNAMGEVLVLGKTVSAVRLVDEVQIQPKMQSKEDKPTSRTSNRYFERRQSRRSHLSVV